MLNVTNSGVSVNLNNVVLTSLDGKKTIQLKNTIFVGRTSGTLTTDSSSLGNFSPTKSAISAFNDTLDISFDTLGTTAQAGLSLLTITLDPKTRAVSEISVSGGIGGSLYKCLVNGTGIGIPACTGVTVAANNRTVTFNNTKVVGGAALATPTTVTLNGTLNAVGR